MCGRFCIDETIGGTELQNIIDVLNRRSNATPVKTSGEIYPTDIVPIITNNRSMVQSAFAMSWGYSLPDGKRIINARSETAEMKPMFRDGIEQRRCVIPATNYFEWERRSKDKTKYAIRPTIDGLMYMAGIYRVEQGLPVFTILTREPAETIEFIHDRMPVILPSEMVSDWIDPKYKASDILKNAVKSVQYQRAEPPAPEQMSLI